AVSGQRGYCYHGLGKLDEAVGDYAEAMRLNPGDSIAARNLAVTYRRRGEIRRAARKFDEALADLGEAIRLRPQEPEAYTERGNVWSQKGDQVKAIADHTAALKI